MTYSRANALAAIACVAIGMAMLACSAELLQHVTQHMLALMQAMSVHMQ